MIQNFPSKKDAWLVGVLWFGVLSMALQVLLAIQGVSGKHNMWLPILFPLIGAVVSLWILYGTYYRLEKDILIIKSCPFSWKIERSQIHEVKLSHVALSNPALSLDRLVIVYGPSRKRICISPERKEEFMKALGHH